MGSHKGRLRILCVLVVPGQALPILFIGTYCHLKFVNRISYYLKLYTIIYPLYFQLFFNLKSLHYLSLIANLFLYFYIF